MVKLVTSAWVAERLGSPEVFILDPRRPMRYLSGHLKGAVNLPLARIFDASRRLRPAGDLGDLFGSAGLATGVTPLIYDSFDGQSGAMMAWVLEYLGCPQACLMNIFYQGWVAEQREVFYRPVHAPPAKFAARVNSTVRATLEQVRDERRVRLLDLRSQEEYAGRAAGDARPGHIPGAVNLPWRELLGQDHRFLDSEIGLNQRLSAVGVGRDEVVTAYCRTGPRAAVGYVALQQIGYRVRLFDGSYSQWSDANLPVEV